MARNRKPTQPSWRDGWDADGMRFIVHKWRDDSCEGGEQWRVIDTYDLIVVGYADTRKQAQLIADALEFLSGHATVAEFTEALA